MVPGAAPALAKAGVGGFVAIANEPHLLQMLWTKVDACNLKAIRPNLKSIGAEISDSENYL